MASSFEIERVCGEARAGTLSCISSGGALLRFPTPALLGLTRRGAPLNLTHDVHATLPPAARLLGVNALAFCADAPPASAVAAGGGAAAFLGLPGCLLLAAARDPLAFDGGRASSDAGLAVCTQAGVRRLSPAAYAQLLLQLRCDVSLSLADECASGEGERRQRAAAERTARWHRDVTASLAARGAEGASVLASLWAVVCGGGEAGERGRAAAAAAALSPQPAGFSLAGFGTGEAPEARPALLAAALAPLPPAAPRHVGGLCSPDELLAAVAGGADLLDGCHAHAATQAGCALVFPVGPAEAAREASAGDGTSDDGDGYRLCLRAPCFVLDARPLLPGCACFACARHSRGYVHHLLEAHEMLAEVLLDVHNAHHMARFMAALRDSVLAGEFDAFRRWHGQRAEDVRAAAAEAAAAPLEGEDGAGL